MNGRYGRFHHTRRFLHRSIRRIQHRNPHLLPPTHHTSPRFLRLDNNIVISTTERRAQRTQIQTDLPIRVVVNHHFAHVRRAHPRGNPDHVVFDLNLRAKLLTTAETEVLPRFHGYSARRLIGGRLISPSMLTIGSIRGVPMLTGGLLREGAAMLTGGSSIGLSIGLSKASIILTRGQCIEPHRLTRGLSHELTSMLTRGLSHKGTVMLTRGSSDGSHGLFSESSNLGKLLTRGLRGGGRRHVPSVDDSLAVEQLDLGSLLVEADDLHVDRVRRAVHDQRQRHRLHALVAPRQRQPTRYPVSTIPLDRDPRAREGFDGPAGLRDLQRRRNRLELERRNRPSLRRTRRPWG